jgi:hypothetical protein
MSLSRVTRLGDFSPIERLFTLGSFLITYIPMPAKCYGNFFHCLSDAYLGTYVHFDKNGRFFTNPSGHSACPSLFYMYMI